MYNEKSKSNRNKRDILFFFFFFSSRRRHTRYWRDWSSDVCSSDLKVRASYTEVGSPITQVGITPGTITDEMNGGVINPISTYPYPDFKPERTKSYEVGVNARFWDGRITFDGTF